MSWFGSGLMGGIIGNAKTNRLIATVALTGLVIGSWAKAQEAPATQPSNTALEEKVRALEVKVNDLETKQAQNQADVAAAIQNVVADTSAHSKLLTEAPEPLLSGYDPGTGFVLRSEDGAFTFVPGLVLDLRNMTAYRERIPAGGGGVDEPNFKGYDTQNGFDLTRVRVLAQGQMTKAVYYYFQFQDDQGTAFGLLDAYATYHFDDSPFYVKAGQFKDPVWHERNLSESRLMAVDRSLVEALIGGGQTGRIQGADLIFDQGPLRNQLVISDGFNSVNTKFYDAGGIAGAAASPANIGSGAGITPTQYGVTERAEFLAIGDRSSQFNPFSEYDQFTALGAKQTILVLGGGADFSQAGSNSVIFHSVDAQLDTTSGFSAYAAYLASYRHINVVQGVAKGSYYDLGAEIQFAYLVTPKIEPFVRYDYTYLDPKALPQPTSDRAEEFTIGANYYLYHQNVKLTLDASWLPEGSPIDEDALGILKDPGHQEFTVRAQLQLAI